MTHVSLKNLAKTYAGSKTPVIHDFSLEIPSGQLIAFLGPSGSGKTTILKMIAGLIAPTSGQILFDGNSVMHIPAEKRGAVMVFQNYLLFPYMSVGENVGFGLKMRRVDKKTIQKRVQEMLSLVKLPDLANRRPSQLSGGQQQRIALARALITDPHVLLLDEPLSNLDAHLRDEMRDLILMVQNELSVTTIFVTHDQEEAVLLADKIALMFDGELHQFAEPREFYNRPVSQRSAQFFGGMNFIPAHREGEIITTDIGQFQFTPKDHQLAPSGDILLTIRPENVRINCGSHVNCLTGTILSCIYVGTHTRYKIKVGNYQIDAISNADENTALTAGQTITVHFPAERLWALPRP